MLVYFKQLSCRMLAQKRTQRALAQEGYNTCVRADEAYLETDLHPYFMPMYYDVTHL